MCRHHVATRPAKGAQTCGITPALALPDAHWQPVSFPRNSGKESAERAIDFFKACHFQTRANFQLSCQAKGLRLIRSIAR
jgi:hypothetical protein